MKIIKFVILYLISASILCADEPAIQNTNDLNRLFTLTFLATIVIIASVFLLFRFFKWSRSLIETDKDGIPNGILGYNIVFDFMAWAITGIIIIISFLLLMLNINKDLIILILGISIGSVLTRTPSFKEKSK